jgi:hypothetical protein
MFPWSTSDIDPDTDGDAPELTVEPVPPAIPGNRDYQELSSQQQRAYDAAYRIYEHQLKEHGKLAGSETTTRALIYSTVLDKVSSAGARATDQTVAGAPEGRQGQASSEAQERSARSRCARAKCEGGADERSASANESRDCARTMESLSGADVPRSLAQLYICRRSSARVPW